MLAELYTFHVLLSSQKKSSRVIAMTHPFPKNQSLKDANLVKNIKMTNLLIYIIRIVSFKTNMLFNSHFQTLPMA